ncbi:sialoadhesin-like [Salminus brasiliensis]|uniref:sialoadhesin-like n=1 Tax=Salminus brasiliensis TaxID=930266 RepID=UPI003B8309B1
MSLTVPLLFLIFISGAAAQDWGVTYKPTSICALKGSAVNMDCIYTYPKGHSVKKAFWSKDLVTDGETPDLLEDPEYRGRVQYLGEKHGCTLRLRDVRENDQRKYYFRFLTDKGGKFQGKDGVDLSVTDLQVEVPERVMEGGKVTLTCKTTCSLTDRPTFTWYRNGASLSSRTDQLHLQSVSREDAGRYHCAVEDQELHSPEVTLNVRYPPKRVSVSISPSGEIVEGSSVTLTCSSDGNPPVQKYTWYKGTSLVATGETFTMKKISSLNSGGYKCRSSNEHGEKSSDTVTLNVLYPPKSVSVSITPSGEIVEGSSVTLTCSSDGNPPVEYTWFKGPSLVATGETFTVKISSVNSGGYKCRSSNEHGEKSSDTVTLNVLYPPKRVSVSISPSGEIVEGSSVTLTCSGDGNPPVQKYTWFKKVDKEVLQKWTNQIHSITNTRSADSGEYQCMATNTQGSRSSEYKSLTVLYPPKKVWVSISPSGEIVEGSSVTLTCSSDGNPPVQKYTWFKGTSLVATGETFTMKKISSLNSGGYKCRSSNEHGEKSSDTVTLDVLYPPKRVLVSISPSGEIVGGSSVTLTCSSDGNPPVQKYTWFRKADKEVLQKWTNQIYSITNIRSADSGEYQCMATNTQGSRSSEYKSLTVLYPPKRVSVYISPSGEIVEDSSVTLTCSSDGNPPVQKYTWFKGTSLVATGETFTMKKISSVNSGGYKCRSSNEHGEKSSDTVTLNVLYPPKSVSVSISPSGEIVEGSSVTLTCSSDGNPPVQKYTWFRKVDKEVLQKWTNQIYSITNTRSADSGEYQCMATNTQGSRSSGYKSLTVLYAPKKVWVSISESAWSSSVTLTCSSDGNPSVQNYTWFKEGGGSPVGSGHSYSAVQSGSYYCVAQNTYGSQTAAAVLVTLEGVNGVKSIGLYAAVGVSAGCLLVIGFIVCVRKVIVSTGLKLTHVSALMSSNAKYPLERVTVKLIGAHAVDGVSCPRYAFQSRFTAKDASMRLKYSLRNPSLTAVSSSSSSSPPEDVRFVIFAFITSSSELSSSVRGEPTRLSMPFCFSLSEGAVAQNWSVIYRPTSICALKGSTVNMDCTYTYPKGHSVQKAFWSKDLVIDGEPPDLLEDPEYRGRVQYLGEKHDCNLRLRDVREKDQRKYYFRFLTDKGEKFQGKDGVDLSVTDLQVEVPERVIEGGEVTLTCKTTCTLTVRPTVTWYRNGTPLSSRTDQLHLQSVSREDAGRYHCAVEDQELHSPEVTLNVRYGPKSTSVSISPSGEIVEGSSVTLTCSSDGNPPVQKYTWFKGTSLVAKGETFTMKKISSVNSGGYKCRSNPPKRVLVSISPSGEIVGGSSVTLTCSSNGNPPVQNYTWFKEGGGSPAVLMMSLRMSLTVPLLFLIFISAPPPLYFKSCGSSHFVLLPPNELSLLQLIIPNSAEMNSLRNELK